MNKREPDNYKYFELQFTNITDSSELMKRTIDLVHFSRLFSIPLRPVQDDAEFFLLELPDDDYLACQMMNVIEVYCNLHKIAHRVMVDPVVS